ncbi:asparagine synthase (glutamine-hydrolyzing) [Thalassobacillus pellis]|uniref:asparagine synthase (glutamine-hydrolyzing) n=1 Tax=Thalassobacillus pellis TaxID=748008 RepID=UPI0019606BDD|nr:asparagine synthase (glutamine-hydrolyzing) [Thalassobacillus pellis]
MCGIVGFTNAGHSKHHEEIIKEMVGTIGHRGPDNSGEYSDERVTLGFQRLQIIDLTHEANQPMFNEDNSIVLVFNGEIYNFEELREGLVAKGHQFKSRADSEVIIHGYEEYGTEILQELRGMFAFAIWDKNEDMLFIARDPFGIKPLYYTQHTSDESFMFGSEIKSFLKNPSFKKELNRQALKPYLTFQYPVLDETFFKGVYKLKAGNYMIYKNGKTEVRPYWQPTFDSKDNDLEYYIERIKETMKESVRYHKISDVPVGSFLSGGIDSSYITALLQPNKTFSVGFQEHEGIFNETNLAEDLSDILGIENHRRLITGDEFFDAIPTIQFHMDEPHSNLSSVPLYFLAELASEHVTVVLSGEGADEIFGGYDWYKTGPVMQRYEKLPFALRRPVSNLAKKFPSNRLTNFLVKGGQRVEEKFIGQAKVFEEKEAERILKEDFKKSPSVQSITKSSYQEVAGKDNVTKMQYIDIKHWLPGDILLKADKMSSAHSLELRVPFLDKEVMKTAGEIPAHLRVNNVDTKYALRKAALEVLPEEWANRKKVGFPVPIRHWLRQEKYYNRVRELFQSQMAGEFFHTDELMRFLDEHYQNKANHQRYIWTVYVFLVWYQKYFIDMQEDIYEDTPTHAYA